MLEPQETDLEKETAALITSMAYEASTIMSLRKLETGGAKEVTGVLRIHGGGAAHSPTEGDRELLYRVRDWNASVFERGQ